MKTKPNIDVAKRYVAYELLQVALSMTALAVNAAQRATTWASKGLTSKEKDYVIETTNLLHQAQVRNRKMAHRLMTSLDKQYGWSNR